MKKFLTYGLAAGALAAASLIVGTPAHAVPATGTASSMTVAPGGTFTATVTNAIPVNPASDNWCYGAVAQQGLSMFVLLDTPVGSQIAIPEETAAGALGSFSWDGSAGATTSVEVTIPADVPVGTYSLKLFCFETGIGTWGSGATVPGDFTIAAAAAPAPAAPLPDTGPEDSAQILFGGLAAAALVAVGVIAIVLRRRLS